MTSVFFPPEGGTIVLGYSIEPCEGEKNVTFQKSDDDWFSITVAPTSLTLTATAGSSREGYVTPLFNGNACSNIIVSQGSCDCSSFIVSGVSTIAFNYIIPASGSPVGTVMGTYTLEGCSDSEIRFDSDLGLVAENGEIKLTRAIAESQESAFTEYDVDIYYGQSNEKCYSDTIFQEGTLVKCDCSGVEYFVESFKKSYPLSGTSEYVMIASGSTHNCGVLSAITSSEIFEDENIDCRYSQDNTKFEFWGKLLPTTANRSGGLRLYYLDNEGVEQECDKSLIVTQTRTYCNCDNQTSWITFEEGFSDDGWVDDNHIVFFNSYQDYLDGAQAIGNRLEGSIQDIINHEYFILNQLEYNWMTPINILKPSNNTSTCRVIWPSSSDVDWIYPACDNNHTWTDCGFYWKPNETNEPRIAHITFDLYIDFDSTSSISFETSTEDEDEYRIISYDIRGCSKCEKQFKFTVLQLPKYAPLTCYTNHKLDSCVSLVSLNDYVLQKYYYGWYDTYFVPANPAQQFRQAIDKDTIANEAVISADTSSADWVYICEYNYDKYLCIDDNNSSSDRSATVTLQVQTESGDVCCDKVYEFKQHPLITDCASFKESFGYYLYCQAIDDHGEYVRYISADGDTTLNMYFFGDSRGWKMSAVTCDASGVDTPSNIVNRIEYYVPSETKYLGGYRMDIIYNDNIYSDRRTQYLKFFYVDDNGNQVGGSDCFTILKTIQYEPQTPTCYCQRMEFNQAEIQTSYPSNYGEIFIGTATVSQGAPYCNSVSASTTHSDLLSCRVVETVTHTTYEVYATIGRNTSSTTQTVTVDINLITSEPRTCDQYYRYVSFNVLPET